MTVILDMYAWLVSSGYPSYVKEIRSASWKIWTEKQLVPCSGILESTFMIDIIKARGRFFSVAIVLNTAGYYLKHYSFHILFLKYTFGVSAVLIFSERNCRKYSCWYSKWKYGSQYALNSFLSIVRKCYRRDTESQLMVLLTLEPDKVISKN